MTNIPVSSSSRKKKRSQGGAVLIEAIIVFSLLIGLFLALFDYFTLSSTYVNLSQVAREGVMTGIGMQVFTGPTAASTCSGIPQVNLQRDPETQAYRNCRPLGAADDTPTCGHFMMQWRIERTLEALRSTRMDPATMTVTTTCTAISGAPSQLQVEISGLYQGLSPFFRNSPMSVRQLGLIR